MGGSRRLASTVGSLAEQAVSLQTPYGTVASGGNRWGGSFGDVREYRRSGRRWMKV
jgi:hypothetical protein